MTNFQTDLENFILWLTELEEVDGDDQLNLINHLLEVGTLDDQAMTFIDQTMENLVKISQSRANELKRKVETLQGAMAGEKTPELSMKKNIVDEAGEDMANISSDFTEDLKTDQKQKNEVQEASEEDENQDMVEQLKAQLA